MKFCSKCGKELFNEAIICPSCGCPAPGGLTPPLTTSISPSCMIQKKMKSGVLGLTITALIMQVVLIILSFVPYFAYRSSTTTVYDSFYYDIYSQYDSSLFYTVFLDNELTLVFGLLLFASFVAGLVLFIIHLILRNKYIATLTLAYVEFILLVAYSFYLSCETSFEISEFGYIYLGLWVVFLIISTADCALRNQQPKLHDSQVPYYS